MLLSTIKVSGRVSLITRMAIYGVPNEIGMLVNVIIRRVGTSDMIK
jgi:hypothetical protein